MAAHIRNFVRFFHGSWRPPRSCHITVNKPRIIAI